jgi:hypothetical protein
MLAYVWLLRSSVFLHAEMLDVLILGASQSQVSRILRSKDLLSMQRYPSLRVRHPPSKSLTLGFLRHGGNDAEFFRWVWRHSYAEV